MNPLNKKETTNAASDSVPQADTHRLLANIARAIENNNKNSVQNIEAAIIRAGGGGSNVVIDYGPLPGAPVISADGPLALQQQATGTDPLATKSFTDKTYATKASMSYALASISALDVAITAETQRAENAELALASHVTASYNTLGGRIQSLDEAIAEEASRAKEAEATLSYSLTSATQTLNQALTLEAERATNAETGLQGQIDLRQLILTWINNPPEGGVTADTIVKSLSISGQTITIENANVLANFLRTSAVLTAMPETPDNASVLSAKATADFVLAQIQAAQAGVLLLDGVWYGVKGITGTQTPGDHFPAGVSPVDGSNALDIDNGNYWTYTTAGGWANRNKVFERGGAEYALVAGQDYQMPVTLAFYGLSEGEDGSPGTASAVYSADLETWAWSPSPIVVVATIQAEEVDLDLAQLDTVQSGNVSAIAQFLKRAIRAVKTLITSHTGSTNNPHGVTAAQVGAATTGSEYTMTPGTEAGDKLTTTTGTIPTIVNKIANAVNWLITEIAKKYEKPATGIPDGDIASAATWNGKQTAITSGTANVLLGPSSNGGQPGTKALTDFTQCSGTITAAQLASVTELAKLCTVDGQARFFKADALVIPGISGTGTVFGVVRVERFVVNRWLVELHTHYRNNTIVNEVWTNSYSTDDAWTGWVRQAKTTDIKANIIATDYKLLSNPPGWKCLFQSADMGGTTANLAHDLRFTVYPERDNGQASEAEIRIVVQSSNGTKSVQIAYFDARTEFASTSPTSLMNPNNWKVVFNSTNNNYEVWAKVNGTSSRSSRIRVWLNANGYSDGEDTPKWTWMNPTTASTEPATGTRLTDVSKAEQRRTTLNMDLGYTEVMSWKKIASCKVGTTASGADTNWFELIFVPTTGYSQGVASVIKAIIDVANNTAGSPTSINAYLYRATNSSQNWLNFGYVVTDQTVDVYVRMSAYSQGYLMISGKTQYVYSSVQPITTEPAGIVYFSNVILPDQSTTVPTANTADITEVALESGSKKVATVGQVYNIWPINIASKNLTGTTEVWKTLCRINATSSGNSQFIVTFEVATAFYNYANTANQRVQACFTRYSNTETWDLTKCTLAGWGTVGFVASANYVDICCMKRGNNNNVVNFKLDVVQWAATMSFDATKFNATPDTTPTNFSER